MAQRSIYCIRCDITYPPQGRKPNRRYVNNEFVLASEDYIVCRCGCWLWRWAIHPSNDAPKISNIYLKKNQNTGHRIIFNVEEEAGVVNMKCGNKSCVNIAHHQVVPQSAIFTKIYGAVNYEIAEQIRDEYNKSKITQPELAKKYSLSYGTINRIIHYERYTTAAHNLVVAKKPVRYYKDEILRLWNLGYSHRGIANRLDLTYTAVYNIVIHNT